ncbi:Las1-like protein, partial [Cryphonectria parasitica EP155]
MVQFVFTPWRNRAELLRVRSQLYPHPSFTTQTAAATTTTTTTTPPLPPRSPWWSGPEELRAIESAIARVFMWVHRGGCPHVVESTALLMSAIVFDERGGHDAVSGAGVTAGYVVGFTRYKPFLFFFLSSFSLHLPLPTSSHLCRLTIGEGNFRFVTGLLDSHQDKARKLSMYGVAKTLGLPASFVELRHQGTHEPMPSLGQLRPAARRALVWIWEYYWKNLPEGEAEEDEEE